MWPQQLSQVSNFPPHSGEFANHNDAKVMVCIKGFAAVKTTIPGATKKLFKRTTNVGVGTLAQKFI